MITLGEIVRQYGAAYRAQYGEQLLPSQEAALRAIGQCRTEVLGGHLYGCPACGATRYSVPLLPQPPLSDLPTRRRPELARSPAGVVAVRALLPGHLHTPLRAA